MFYLPSTRCFWKWLKVSQSELPDVRSGSNFPTSLKYRLISISHICSHCFLYLCMQTTVPFPSFNCKKNLSDPASSATIYFVIYTMIKQWHHSLLVEPRLDLHGDCLVSLFFVKVTIWMGCGPLIEFASDLTWTVVRAVSQHIRLELDLFNFRAAQHSVKSLGPYIMNFWNLWQQKQH